jgi:hypothetical protein
MAIAAEYCPRHPEESPLYTAIAGHLETFLARQRELDRPLPSLVEREFRELPIAFADPKSRTFT